MLETICNKLKKKLRAKGPTVAIGLRVIVDMLDQACKDGDSCSAEWDYMRAHGYLLCLKQLDVISQQEMDALLSELMDRRAGVRK